MIWSDPARLAWMVRRASRMSPVEMVWRVWEQVKRGRDRRRPFGWDAFESPAYGLRALDGLDLGTAQRISPDGAPISPDDAREGRLSRLSPLLSDLGPGFWRNPEVWRRDPATGAPWPHADRFAFDIPYRQAPEGMEVRRLWELNRLGWLPVLAIPSMIESPANNACDPWSPLAAWMDANPPFRGLAWAGGVEAASRIASVLALVATCGLPPPRYADRVRTFLNAHVWWIARYPSRFSSANNHRTAELCALYLASLAAPGAPFGRRRTPGLKAAVERQALGQFHADGVGREQSPAYGAYALEWLSTAAAAAKDAPAFSPEAKVRLAAASAHLAWMRDAGGRTPSIGDDDHSRVLMGDPAPDQPIPPETGMRTFANGGLTVWRPKVQGAPMLLVFDHGPLGHLSIAAHGHADALSVWLHWGDETVLADAGTGLYHGAGAARDRFRGTAAHNTLCLEGADQSRIVGPFAWAAHARSRIVDTGESWVEADHDGYRRRFGLIHRRRVKMGGAGIDIEDRLLGRPMRPGLRWRIGFLLPSGATAEAAGRTASVVTGSGRRLTFLAEDAADGWRIAPAEISPRFGVVESTVRLTLEGAGTGAGGLVARTRILFG